MSEVLPQRKSLSEARPNQEQQSGLDLASGSLPLVPENRNWGSRREDTRRVVVKKMVGARQRGEPVPSYGDQRRYTEDVTAPGLHRAGSDAPVVSSMRGRGGAV